MKYVMFTHRETGLRVPVFCSDHTSHCDLSAGKDWIATSAGSYSLETATCYGKAESLGMVPASGDQELCTLVVQGMESMLILFQDLEANKRALKRIKHDQN